MNTWCNKQQIKQLDWKCPLVVTTQMKYWASLHSTDTVWLVVTKIQTVDFEHRPNEKPNKQIKSNKNRKPKTNGIPSCFYSFEWITLN